MSKKQKKAFVHLFRALDRGFSHVKAFTRYEEEGKSIFEELKPTPDNPDDTDDPILDDYDLIAYNKLRIDFEYIVQLLQGFVESFNSKDEFQKKLSQLREIVDEFAKTNPKLGFLLNKILDEIVEDKEKFIGQDMSIIIYQMRNEAIRKEVDGFAEKWFLDPEDVGYEVYNYKDGVIANENNLKEKVNYAEYKKSVSEPLPKFKFRKEMIEAFRKELMENVAPLL